MTYMKASALGPTTAGPTPSILSLVWTTVLVQGMIIVGPYGSTRYSLGLL